MLYFSVGLHNFIPTNRYLCVTPMSVFASIRKYQVYTCVIFKLKYMKLFSDNLIYICNCDRRSCEETPVDPMWYV